MAATDSPESNLVPLIDLLPDEAIEVCAAMTNVGLHPSTSRVLTNHAETVAASVRVSVPASELWEAKTIVEGVLPQYRRNTPADASGSASRSPSGSEPTVTPVTDSPTGTSLPSTGTDFDNIVAGLRADGFKERDSAEQRNFDQAWEEAEQFQPPEPPPLPRISKVSIVSLLGIIFGVGLVLLGSAGGAVDTFIVLVGMASVLAGIAGLVMRLRDDPVDHDDDGAIV